MENKVLESLMRLAIHLLDRQDGIEVETYDLLKEVMMSEGSHQFTDLMANVTVASKRAFLNEDWVEENYHRWEN